jgi:hypothetical protein
MIGEFRSSLYDLFGYLLPGVVATAALVLFIWPWLGPELNLPISVLLTSPFIWVFFTASNFIGHGLHAAGNCTIWLMQFEEGVLDQARSDGVSISHGTSALRFVAQQFRVKPLSPALQLAIQTSVAAYIALPDRLQGNSHSAAASMDEVNVETEEVDNLTGTTLKERIKSVHSTTTTKDKHTPPPSRDMSSSGKLSAKEAYLIMDEARALLPREGDREVYVYREGFYRGCVYAFGILLVAAAVRWVLGPASYLMDYGRTVTVARWNAFVLMFIALGLVISSFVRARRFGATRVQRAAALWFAVLAQLQTKKA